VDDPLLDEGRDVPFFSGGDVFFLSGSSGKI
jgi:hypothetical protein